MRRPAGAALLALGAAVLFGGSTPFVKLLVGELPPVMLAGLLYLGSGIGLSTARFARDRRWESSRLGRGEWPWLAGAVAFGGVLGPALLMLGLALTDAGTVSLLLNLESVLTALLAWIVFRENADRRIVAGMMLIVAGGVVLSWPREAAGGPGWLGPALVAAACLCWAIDNNLTRKVSASDALFIASVKGLVAGPVNIAVALAAGAALPAPAAAGAAMAVGLLGYGVSLALFVLALRGLGAARTGAYFSVAPFVGAALAIAMLGESPTGAFWIAAALMAAGVYLHLTEHHEHAHAHEAMAHEHPHGHDEHHRHEHDFEWDGREPHAHPHVHEPMRHRHPHYPDVHHRHDH